MTAPATSLVPVEREDAPADFNKWLRFVAPLVYAKKHKGAAIPAGVLDLATDAYFAGLLMGDDLQADVRARLADESRPHLDVLMDAGIDARDRGELRDPFGVWQLDGGMAADAAWFLMAGTPAAGRIMGRRAGRSAVDLQARGLMVWHALWQSQYVDALAAGLKGPQHPAGPLVVHFVESFPPPAKVDSYPRGTMPRLVTSERLGELATLEAPNVPELGEIEAAPQLAYIPGLAPPDSTPGGIMPASWLALIDGFSRAHDDPREWQRGLRLLIEVVSTPDPLVRVGTVSVPLRVVGADGIIARLWSDGRTREHYPALRRALGLAVSAALPASDGHAYLPAQLDRWQRPDALAFNVTYPRDGGNGATFDRAAFRRYGVHPHLFRVYLAVVWALDSRRLRRGDGDHWLAALTLDALATLATYPDVPQSYRARDKARRRTRAALDRLASDGAVGGYDLAGRGSRERLELWRPRLALASPDDAGRECG